MIEFLSSLPPGLVPFWSRFVYPNLKLPFSFEPDKEILLVKLIPVSKKSLYSVGGATHGLVSKYCGELGSQESQCLTSTFGSYFGPQEPSLG